MGRTIPIIKLRDNLIVSIQIELTDMLVAELKENVALEVRLHEVSGLVLEVSAVDFLDSYIANSIQQIAKIAGCMGVQTILAGLDPSVAITLVEMGADMGVETALNLESALDRLEHEQQVERARDAQITEMILNELASS